MSNVLEGKGRPEGERMSADWKERLGCDEEGKVWAACDTTSGSRSIPMTLPFGTSFARPTVCFCQVKGRGENISPLNLKFRGSDLRLYLGPTPDLV